MQVQVAEAIAWLACRGLLYWDLGPPNAIVNDVGKQAYLIDYGDMRVRKV